MSQKIVNLRKICLNDKKNYLVKNRKNESLGVGNKNNFCKLFCKKIINRFQTFLGILSPSNHITNSKYINYDNEK